MIMNGVKGKIIFGAATLGMVLASSTVYAATSTAKPVNGNTFKSANGAKIKSSDTIKKWVPIPNNIPVEIENANGQTVMKTNEGYFDSHRSKMLKLINMAIPLAQPD